MASPLGSTTAANSPSGPFTDGSEGIFVSNAVAVPEPATAALLIAGIATYLSIQSPQKTISANPQFPATHSFP